MRIARRRSRAQPSVTASCGFDSPLQAGEVSVAAMLFSSYTFLFQFLPAVALAFAAARRHSPRAGIMVLVAASLFFYAAWKPVYLAAGRLDRGQFLARLKMEDPAAPPPHRHVRRRAQSRAAVLFQIHQFHLRQPHHADRRAAAVRQRHPAARHLLLHLPADRLSGRRHARRQGRARHRQLHAVRLVLPASDRRAAGASRRDDPAIQARALRRARRCWRRGGWRSSPPACSRKS